LSVDAANKDLLCGVYVPFIIPAHLSQMDLGEAFADLVNLVEESFTSEFQKYEFHDYSDKNYLKNMLVKQKLSLIVIMLLLPKYQHLKEKLAL
jgi:hypothetical protein